MEDKRAVSLKRAAELKAATEGYSEYKKVHPFATSDVVCAELERKKNEILRYFDATNDDWNDWKWQLGNRISDTDILSQFMHFSDKEIAQIEEISNRFRWATTPYYLSLMDFSDRTYPINMMAIPSINENILAGVEDPMDEEHTNPASRITRRYPNRLIINVTSACAMFCRHCQRRRLIGECDHNAGADELSQAYEYIRSNPEIRDVLVTGGDPLLLSDEALEDILKNLRSIPTVEIVRIGTRVPVTMPQRVTDDLVNMLKKYHPLYMNLQFNHPSEVTKDAVNACTKLANAGIPLGNQMVFLKGINDNKYTVQMLNEELLKTRVRPYYIFHPKQVIGTGHFQITVKEGLEIMEYLRGHTSGLAIPQYILNAPLGLGKIPLLPEYIIENDDSHVKLRTWEGQEVNIVY